MSDDETIAMVRTALRLGTRCSLEYNTLAGGYYVRVDWDAVSITKDCARAIMSRRGGCDVIRNHLGVSQSVFDDLTT